MSDLVERHRKKAAWWMHIADKRGSDAALLSAAISVKECCVEIERLENEIKAAIPHNQQRRFELNRLQDEIERLHEKDKYYKKLIAEECGCDSITELLVQFKKLQAAVDAADYLSAEVMDAWANSRLSIDTIGANYVYQKARAALEEADDE